MRIDFKSEEERLMKQHPLSESIQSGHPMSWLAGVLMAAVVVGGAWVIVATLLNAPQARAMAEREKADEIAREDRAFCGKLGMTPTTQSFVTCAAELAHIRRRQEERVQRDNDLF